METDIIFGVRTILEAIKADKPIDKVWLLKGPKNKLFEQLIGLLHANNISFSYVPIRRLDRFTSKNHQGAVARISAIETYKMLPLLEKIITKNRNPIFVLLDGITDARNFGAIMRSSAAIGVDAIIIPKNRSASLNSDAIKTSVGGAFRVPIIKVNHLKDAIYFLRENGILLIAITEKAIQTIYEKDLKYPIALIIGSEDLGISKGILKIIQCKAKLPMSNRIDSLNVSVACGVVFYEVIRQRNYSN